MSVRNAVRFSVHLFLVSAVLTGAPAGAAVCRVTTTGSQFNDGGTWATATTLRQALTFPQFCTEVWVAAGVYKPGVAAEELNSFTVGDGVQVYGGFAGSETVREQRDPAGNLTVLSGDIDNNDTAVNGVVVDASGIAGSNSLTVVRMFEAGPTTVLDGFTITAGLGGGGAGLRLSADSSQAQCKPVLSRLVFSGNAALKGGDQRGGGMSILANSVSRPCTPALSDIVFRGNHAGAGGAIYNHGTAAGLAGPTLTRVLFDGNKALDSGGGAILNLGSGGGQANAVLSQVTFRGNTANGMGGAIHNVAGNSGSTANASIDRAVFIQNTASSGGAIANSTQGPDGGAVNPSITNSTFSGNAALAKGGAVYNWSVPANSVVNPALNNVTFAGNQVSIGGDGGALASDRSGGSTVAALRNAILWGNPAPGGQELVLSGGAIVNVDHSIVKGSGGSAAWNSAFGTNGGGNLDANPLLGPLGEDFGGTQTMRPAAGSPAIDAGLNCTATDQRGIARPQGPACDMGTVEVVNIDPISRNGFESSCSATSLTPSAFLARIRTALDGVTVCIPPFADTIIGVAVNACFNNNCPGATPGCPITIAAGPFGDGGDFRAGHFSASGTASNVTVPVDTNFVDCVYTAGNIVTSYTVDYFLTDDGDGGVYSAILNGFAPAATSFTLTSDNSTCNNLADNIKPAFANEAAEAVVAARRAAIEAATLDETVCPVQ